MNPKNVKKQNKTIFYEKKMYKQNILAQTKKMYEHICTNYLIMYKQK